MLCDISAVPVKKEERKGTDYEDKQYPHSETPLISDSLRSNCQEYRKI